MGPSAQHNFILLHIILEKKIRKVIIFHFPAFCTQNNWQVLLV